MFHSNSFYILYGANSSAERGRKGQALIIGRVWKRSEKVLAEWESKLARGTWQNCWLC